MGVTTIRFESSYVDNLRWFSVEGYNGQLIPLLLYSVGVQFVIKLRSADLLFFDQLILDQKRLRCNTFQSADSHLSRVGANHSGGPVIS
jgi:hypothetical protein